MNISKASRYFSAIVLALRVLASVIPGASGHGVSGVNVVILLRVTGDIRALPQMRSCLTSRLSQMPDVEITLAPTDGERFIVDIIAEKGAGDGIAASLVIEETFPMEQFRLRVKEGEDGNALSAAIGYYTLLRLHEVVPGRSAQNVCGKITAEISDKVLSREYTERDD